LDCLESYRARPKKHQKEINPTGKEKRRSYGEKKKVFVSREELVMVCSIDLREKVSIQSEAEKKCINTLQGKKAPKREEQQHRILLPDVDLREIRKGL